MIYYYLLLFNSNYHLKQTFVGHSRSLSFNSFDYLFCSICLSLSLSLCRCYSWLLCTIQKRSVYSVYNLFFAHSLFTFTNPLLFLYNFVSTSFEWRHKKNIRNDLIKWFYHFPISGGWTLQRQADNKQNPHRAPENEIKKKMNETIYVCAMCAMCLCRR